MSECNAPDLPEDWLEADTWASWWAAHRAIAEQVRAGERELPELFRPREVAACPR
jgi:hypothetical protein